ncbi:MAG: mannose-1-phosphate guanylyltransferase [Pyrinomonadaceae bacterium]
MIALFIAGGSGTRLWPLSRENNPKQLHSIIGSKSLMTQTIERMKPLLEPKDIWIVTGKNYAMRIAECSPGVPREQIITEPFPLGKNLAVGLGVIHIARNSPEAIIVIGWTDSYIGKKSEFHAALQKAALLASKVDGVILAAPATYPATAYGYIKVGELIPEHKGAFKIACFEEKPNIERAEQFLKSPSYFWNTGISVWKISNLLELIKKHTPEHYAALKYVSEAIGTSSEAARMEEAFKNLDRMEIERAIFEKAAHMATIPVDLDWSDVGSWSAIYDIQSQGGGNVTRGSVVAVNTDSCLIYGQKRLIATLGVSDLVIVETDDAILIARKDDAQGLEELHAKVKEFGGKKYL